VTGAANLIFLGLAMSGLFLWFPREWTIRHLRPIMWFRGGLAPKARDFNWHNVFGFWCALPLAIVILTALPFSYSWANRLVYRLAGSETPVPASRPSRPPDAPAASPAERWAGIDEAWRLPRR
jgi:uncharacterized iron-regulated membrane protein